MDHHPRVLEQRVQALAVGRRVGQRDERVALHQEHEQEGLHQGQEEHGPAFEGARGPHQHHSHQAAVERPQEEGPLLAAPEARDQVIRGQVARAVLVDVFDLELVGEDQPQQIYARCDQGQRHDGEEAARQGAQAQDAAAHREVQRHRAQRGQEPGPDECVSEEHRRLSPTLRPPPARRSSPAAAASPGTSRGTSPAACARGTRPPATGRWPRCRAPGRSCPA